MYYVFDATEAALPSLAQFPNVCDLNIGRCHSIRGAALIRHLERHGKCIQRLTLVRVRTCNHASRTVSNMCLHVHILRMSAFLSLELYEHILISFVSQYLTLHRYGFLQSRVVTDTLTHTGRQ
jgi:hypothetical protein